MQLSATEISELIQQKIQNFDAGVEARTEGTVVSLTDGIARIHGLSDVMQGEMIEFPGNIFGMALNLERDSVGVVVLGDYTQISEGATAKCTGRILEVPTGRKLLGRVVNALGEPVDGKGPIEADEFAPVEKVAPGVIARQSVDQPVQTVLKAIDAMEPIVRGQRERLLVIGRRVKLRWPSTRSSTSAILALNASTSLSVRKLLPLPALYVSSKSTAPWTTPSWLPRPRLNPPRFSSSRPTLDVPWVNSSATVVKMHSSSMMT